MGTVILILHQILTFHKSINFHKTQNLLYLGFKFSLCLLKHVMQGPK